MIKSKYILGTFLSAGFLLTACQSDPEVGSTLYPTEAEDYSPKAYISNVDINKKDFSLKTWIEQGLGQTTITVPNDTLTFRVKLTEAASKDLTFMIKSDNSKLDQGAASAGTFTKIGNDALKFAVDKVVVKQGAMESKDVFKVALDKDAQSLLNLTGAGKVAFTIESLDGTKIGKRYDTYIWNLQKNVTNVNSAGTMAGLSNLPVADYVVSNGYSAGYTMDPDGFLSGGNVIYTSFGNAVGKTIHIELNNPTAISGLGILSAYMYSGSNLKNYALNDVEIFAGMTSTDLKKVGNAYRNNKPTQREDPWNIIFYQPITVKYIDIVCHNTFRGTGNYAYTAGLRLYKK